MKSLFVLFLIIVGTIIGFLTMLQNGSLIRYLDSHPHPQYVPPVEFFIGSGYYLLNDLQMSATYYQRIAERYPRSRYADDAYFSYLQSLDDQHYPRAQMADAYYTYLERFPKGDHVEVAQKRIEYYGGTRRKP